MKRSMATTSTPPLRRLRWQSTTTRTANKLLNGPQKTSSSEIPHSSLSSTSSHRLFCARKGIRVVDVVLENPDVGKALLHYINSRKISNIVVGAAKGNALTRKFRHIDVPAALLKLAPDFCSVYVIWKEKVLNARSAKTQLASTNLLTIPHLLSLHRHSLGAVIDTHEYPRNDSTMPSSEGIRNPPDNNVHYMRGGASSFGPSHLHNYQHQQQFCPEVVDLSGRHSSSSSSFRSSEYSGSSTDDSFSNDGNGSSTLESDVMRLKLELKQTMDMYNDACSEAVKARKQAKELQLWKMEESRKIEQVKQAQEEAIQMADKEKARCKAAMEETEKAQMRAELEIRRRRTAENTAAAADDDHQYTFSYRKYTIEKFHKI